MSYYRTYNYGMCPYCGGVHPPGQCSGMYPPAMPPAMPPTMPPAMPPAMPMPGMEEMMRQHTQMLQDIQMKVNEIYLMCKQMSTAGAKG